MCSGAGHFVCRLRQQNDNASRHKQRLFVGVVFSSLSPICSGSAWISANRSATFLSAGAFRVYRHPAELRRSLDELALS